MSKNDIQDPLNKISSAVSERDKRVWQNAAHSICIKKQTEKLKSKIARLKTATSDKQKENKILEGQLADLTKSLSIQRETLTASEQSVLVQKSLKENLVQEANEMRKKYAATLEMYDDELRDYRAVYENASKSYKDLKTQQIELKKLEIEKMDLDTKIENLEKIQEQFKDIQERIFQQTIVRFAEFYCLYHKREKICLEVQEKKKEEQQLLKQHLQLSEAVKQKQRKKSELNRARTTHNSSTSVEKASQENERRSKESNELITEKLRKFLDEDLKPCSLTSFSASQRVLNFNKDNSKVKILDVKMMAPSKITTVKKPNFDLRKKMVDIMESTKKEALRNNSFQISPFGSQQSQEGMPEEPQQSQNKTKEVTPTGSQHSAVNSKVNLKSGGSQHSQPGGVTVSSAKQEEKPLTPKDIATGSILKPPSQVITEKIDVTKQENVSKFFNPKKKTVTFQSETRKEAPQATPNSFQLFGGKENDKVEVYQSVKDVELFPKSFFFKNDGPLKQDEKKVVGNKIKQTAAAAVAAPETETEPTEASNVSYTMETGLTFSTYGGESTDKKTGEDLTFDIFDTSFNRNFGQPPLNVRDNYAEPSESTTFNFLGSQSKNNPFSMF